MSPFDIDRIGAGLTFAEALGALQDALAGGVCVVQAPPGSGKTTLTPPVVANAVPGRVIVTQPRRVAVRSAARRLAELSGIQLGQEVGYSVRGEARVSAETVVEFVTPGLLIRRLLADPELTGVGAVILDEVHERSLDVDLLIGMVTDVRALREDLTLVAMSATLDAATFAELLGDDEPTPIVDSPSALHPLEIRYAPASAVRMDERGVTREFLKHVAGVTRAAVRSSDADALVFLPGVREVEGVVELLRDGSQTLEVLPLHGRLDSDDQDHVMRGRAVGDTQRVIVSTDVAESSITVPGVRIVVDSGLSRQPRRDAARNMSGLVTVAASQAEAEQRAGRAARLGPGLAVRCFDAQTFSRMPAHRTPEITQADLTDAALILAGWGTPRGVGLRLPTAPPDRSINQATEKLVALGALDTDERPTNLGQRLLTMPLAPQLGAGLLTAAPLVGLSTAAETVAALADDFRAPDASVKGLLRQLRSGSHPGGRRWEREARRLERLAQQAANAGETPKVAAEFRTGVTVASAYPERVARRVGGADSRVYLMASGSRAALPQGSALQHSEWLAVSEVSRVEGPASAGTGAVIRLAAHLDEAHALECAKRLRRDDVRARLVDGKVVGRQVKAVGAIELSSTPTKPTPGAARAAVEEAIAADGMGWLKFSDAAERLRRRMAFAHRHLGEPWPAVDDEALAERVEDWFGPELTALATGTRATNLDVSQALSRLLPWPEATRFGELVPERLAVPSGSTIAIEYPEVGSDGPPVVAVKLQECFGLTQTPRLADGRVGVQFHLLSPARRPLAITEDLASFWAGPYSQVRAEMRARYPKHPWPEDPSSHVATAKTKRRLEN